MDARAEAALTRAGTVVAEMTVLHGAGHPAVRWAERVAVRGAELLRGA